MKEPEELDWVLVTTIFIGAFLLGLLIGVWLL